jgi:hypothetical protein
VDVKRIPSARVAGVRTPRALPSWLRRPSREAPAAGGEWSVPLWTAEGAGSAPFPSPGVLVAAYLAFWAGQFALWLAAYREAGFPDVVSTASFDALSWMVVGTLSMGVGFVLPGRRGPSAGLFAAILMGAVCLVLVRVTIIVAFAPVFDWVVPSLGTFFMQHLPRHTLITTSYVGLGCGLRSALRSRRQQARMSRLDSLLANTRLVALRTHLRPRILLGAMQSIAGQIVSDPHAADARLIALSDLLRLQLGRARQTRVSVDQEIDFVRRYVEVDLACSGSATALEAVVDDAAHAAQVPPNCVSILVEAVLRAAPESAEPLRIDLEVRVHGPVLELTLRDTCPVPVARRGLEEWDEVRELAETTRSEFGSWSAPEFTDVPGGVVTRLRLPFQPPAV